ncbi:phosphate signaling complex protein PhoU [Algicella marina]|nr:phosphate signaling complex protein PhoU [Algicella marina]
MNMGPHIVKSFDDDLIAIQAKIAEMGGKAEDLLRQALEAVEKRDKALAQKVIDADKKIDALEMEIEEMATTVIALRQPMAQDLRVLISALKICSTLERIGDLAKNISKRAMMFSKAGPLTITSSIVRMGRATLAQLTEVLDAYTSRDTAKAVAVWQKDVDIDEMYNALFREVVTYMMEDSRMIGAGSQMLFIAKNLERIGDHTTHISEMIHYIVEGKPLGDDRPKGEPLGLDLE